MTQSDYRRILKDKNIKYRACLNLPNEITFGIEIEYENVLNELVSILLSEEQKNNPNFRGWKNKKEIDLSERNSNQRLMNGEVNSPILTDNIKTWKNLRTVLNILNNSGAIITNQCGGHVNIGAHVLGYNTEYWRNFLLLWTLYEKEIYKFSSGEFLKVRVRNDSTIDQITSLLRENLSIIVDLGKNNNDIDIHDYLEKSGIILLDKTHDVSLFNFVHPKFLTENRIEFRVPNGTLKEEIWQNYINFFAKFLLACKKELDVDKVVYNINHNEHSVLDLADYVFEDNIDKDNFLIQTLKTNPVYKKELPLHITKY